MNAPAAPTLDPGIVVFLKEIEARVGPGKPNPAPAERRWRMERMARAFALPRPAGLDVADWQIALPGREIPIRIYRPAGEGGRPAILFLHGGGWVAGSLDSHDPLATRLAVETGCTVIAVQFRRPPENPHPAPLDDCYAALLWLQDNADFAGIDPARIAIVGDSAGGHLALTCALRAIGEGTRAPAALGLLYPVIEPDFSRASYQQFAGGPFLTRDDMIYFWRELLGGETTSTDPLAVPALSEHLDRLPPTFVVAAEIDPLRDEAEAFAARLASLGVEVVRRRGIGLPHGFFRAIQFSPVVVEEMTALSGFLRHRLAGATA